MGMEQFRAPALPLAGVQYDPQYMNQLAKVLRLYFSQLDSDTACKAYSYRAQKIITDTTAGATVAMGEMAWNSTDETLDLGMAFGVTQQIGLETYARVQNNTGVTIPNGTVVGFVGVGAGSAMSVAPYIANGSLSTLNILGVMTHDLPDTGDVGYCTVWGSIRGLNTSAFTLGDILYASPTVLGGYTRVKPTAPNTVVPLAAVLKVGTTDGIIFVRPTIEQPKYYGVFSDTVTKTAAAIYTPQALTFDTTDFAYGISRGTPTSRIVASNAGLYNFQFSAELTSGNASAKNIWIWPRINGVDVINTNSKISITGADVVSIAAWNWVLSLTAGQYFELMFAVDDTNVQILAVVAQTGANGTATFARPAVPSIILTVTQVQQ